ncbi:AfsR/SARP family transcriptional regulator [Parafrankia discariae]|uniref:AfsR/SARP family transcriptional regulator n=1 Tax=Parafrankia discariae TaxID=365528 RepID=UPI0003A68C8F|nr:AfsR/SARP family transcriptional regulator [Parafrankia discariae]
MKFRVLGSVEVEAGGRAHRIPGARQRLLLATLLVSGGRPVPAELLHAELWGENPPATVENSLHATVSRLRRALRKIGGGRPPALLTRAPGYLLDVDADDLDLTAFRAGVARARVTRGTDPERAHAILQESLGLWRGAPLQNITAGPLCRGTVLQLEEEYLAAVEDGLRFSVEHRDPAYVVGELRRVSFAHPWHERIIDLLMLALYRCGRQAEAILTYNDVRERLSRELGVEPSALLRNRFEEILNHAPSLG